MTEQPHGKDAMSSILEVTERSGYERVNNFDALGLTAEEMGKIRSRGVWMKGMESPDMCFFRGTRSDGSEVKAFINIGSGPYASGYIFSPAFGETGYVFGNDFSDENLKNLLEQAMGSNERAE